MLTSHAAMYTCVTASLKSQKIDASRLRQYVDVLQKVSSQPWHRSIHQVEAWQLIQVQHFPPHGHHCH